MQNVTGKDTVLPYLSARFRYDQSSLNIITQSLLERDGWRRNNDDDEMIEFLSIQRGDTEDKKLYIPCRS